MSSSSVTLRILDCVVTRGFRGVLATSNVINTTAVRISVSDVYPTVRTMSNFDTTLRTINYVASRNYRNFVTPAIAINIAAAIATMSSTISVINSDAILRAIDYVIPHSCRGVINLAAVINTVSAIATLSSDNVAVHPVSSTNVTIRAVICRIFAAPGASST